MSHGTRVATVPRGGKQPEHGYDGQDRDGAVLDCRCGEKFEDRAALRAHVREVKAAKRGAVRVILAHTTGPAGVRQTVAVGPQYSTEQTARERFQLEKAGAECEVVSLMAFAQWQRATLPAKRAEAGR